ncbi:MAG: hypothetical protein GC181_05280 [Bacteroidetes bacterium]|nr:hypothetical protein [Bacteroidota bacterium]
MNSRFYGDVFFVKSTDQVSEYLEKVKSEKPGATHYCYAFRIGINGENYRYSDDGEPGNSAGAPIYRQLLSFDVVMTLVVVTRFYGGKKLGVPGLIKAYGETARLALENSVIELTQPKLKISIREITAKDYMIYELANRFHAEISEAAVKPGGYFKMEIEYSQYELWQAILKELPNFEWVAESDLSL